MPEVFFYGLYTLFGQVLIAKERFGGYAWAPVLNNIVSCIGLGAFVILFGSPRFGNAHIDTLVDWTPEKILLLAGSATLGIAAQALILIIPLKKSGFKWKAEFGIHDFGLIVCIYFILFLVI